MMRRFLPLLLAGFALGLLVAGCGGSNTTDASERLASSAGGTVKPIQRKTCPSKTGSQAFFGRLQLVVVDKPIWVMSADVDCSGFSGKSNPTKMAKVGPSRLGGRPNPEGWVNPFRLEVNLGKLRSPWLMRIVKKTADGKFKELHSFGLTFAHFPKKPGYTGLFMCVTRNCQDVTAVKKCPDAGPGNFNCGFPPPAPYRVGRGSSYFQKGTVWRFPPTGGFGPLVVETSATDDPAEGVGEFTISIVESRHLLK